MTKFLIIQTAFIGDVILATPLIEKLKQFYPESQIDVVLRKGNESLLKGHPLLNEVLIWDKKNKKYQHLLELVGQIRKTRYDHVINLQRFSSSGFLTFRSRASQKVGFDKNPFSFCFNRKVKHDIDSGKHEVERNLELIQHLTDSSIHRPKLHPGTPDYAKIEVYRATDYFCIAPTSVWHTKQFPVEKWLELMNRLDHGSTIYLLGSPDDQQANEGLKNASEHPKVINLAGTLTLLESAALMEGAVMNYTNDSAPMHLASAMNAPVTAVFCSTVPSFGFGPLSDDSSIVETKEKLNCRPCGLHGHKACPEGHFNCAHTIHPDQFRHAG